MSRLEVLVVLLVAAIPFVALARRVNIAYPVVLVLAGLAIGTVPGLPPIALPPDAVLIVFLPPLLFFEAIGAPLGALRAHASLIRTLVLGLVIATTIVVALVAHAIVPDLPWAAAFVLGAVVAPTDAVAFSPIAERLGVPRRIVAVVQGEGLLNDASALVLYGAAVAALTTGDFSFRTILGTFAFAVVVGIALGAATAAVVSEVTRRLSGADLQTALCVLTPFLAFLLAMRLHASAVLAVVTAGLWLNRRLPFAMSAETRQQLSGFAQTVVFLLNTLIFFLVGLQLHPIVTELTGRRIGRVVVLALVIGLTVIAVRAAWIFALQLIRSRRYRIAERPEDEGKERLVIAWAGFRGGVSLAAALAIPAANEAGVPFLARNLIIFVTFGVIIVTLVGQGMTLPWLVSALRLREDEAEGTDVRLALTVAATAALQRLDELEAERLVEESLARPLRAHYEHRLRRAPGDAEAHSSLSSVEVERQLIAAERTAVIASNVRGEIETTTLHRVLGMLDLTEIELERFGAVEDAARERELHP